MAQRLPGAVVLLAALLLAAARPASAELHWASAWPQGSHLNGVWASDAADLYAVGDEGVILHSTDGGQSWRRERSGTTLALHAVWGSGPRDVYAVGELQLVLRSTDGGRTWKKTPPPTRYTTALYAVWGRGPGEVYVAGVNGALARSSDGGASWTPLPLGSYRTVYGLAGGPGGALLAVGEGGHGWSSRDGGGSWTGHSSQGPSLRAAVASGAGWLVVGDGGTAAQLDAGLASQPRTTGQRGSLRAAVLHGTTLLVAGETAWNQQLQRSLPALLRSTDGGLSWQAQVSPLEASLHALWTDGHGIVWAVGQGGAMIQSRDGGASWTARSSQLPRQTLTTVVRLDRGVLVASESGGLWRSDEAGGLHGPRPLGDGVQAGVALGSTVVLVGRSGILRSVDGGGSFAAVGPTGKDVPLLSGVARVGAAGLVAVGERGQVLVSADAGASWQRVSSGVGQALRGVASEGALTVAVGELGTVLLSADGGRRWRAAVTGARHRLVAVFTDGQRIVAVGQEWWPPRRGRGDEPPRQAVIFSSRDSGTSWSTRTGGAMYAWDTVIGQGRTLFVAGARGTVARSGDGGQSWTPLASPSARHLRGASWDGQTLWLVGDDGTVLAGDGR